MDWFERLTGFRETGYEETRRQLTVDGQQLRSLVNGKSYGIGELELVSLDTLRTRVAINGARAGQLKVSILTGDVRELHRLPEYSGALGTFYRVGRGTEPDLIEACELHMLAARLGDAGALGSLGEYRGDLVKLAIGGNRQVAFALGP